MAMVDLASISCLVKGVNPFDTNSVLVKLTQNLDVLGHLECAVAAGIAEVMDKFEYQVKVVGYVE